MIDSSEEYTFDIIHFGSYYIGKTYLLNRYINNVFSSYFTNQNYSEYKTKDISIRNKKIKLKLWETKYQSYKNMTNYNFKKANGIMIMYDITYSASLTDMKPILNSIDDYLNEDAKRCKILVGCKSDSTYKSVKEDQGKSLAKEHNIPFFETSAKTNTNVTEIFEFLANKILRYKENELL